MKQANIFTCFFRFYGIFNKKSVSHSVIFLQCWTSTVPNRQVLVSSMASFVHLIVYSSIEPLFGCSFLLRQKRQHEYVQIEWINQCAPCSTISSHHYYIHCAAIFCHFLTEEYLTRRVVKT